MTPRPTQKHKKQVPAPPTAAPVRAAGAWPAYAPWLGLALLTFFAYLPTLWAGYVWDDGALTENPLLLMPGGFWKIWTHPGLMPHEQHYWPLVYSMFWLEHLVVGMHPFLYHLDNMLLQGGVVVLLWRVLVRLGVPGAWLAAALFAVHPVHAESVAWAIERKDVLSGFFYAGAALAFLRFCDEPPAGRRGRWYALALGLFLAALLSKSSVIALPLVLALVLWWRRGAGPGGATPLRGNLLALVPLTLLAAAATAADLVMFHSIVHKMSSGLSFPQRVLMAGGSLWFYLGKLAWPYPLATFYYQWKINPGSPLAWLPLLGWGALLGGLWAARRRLGRGPFTALACFTLTITPVLGLIDFEFLHYSWVADRFQYLPSMGPLTLAAAGLTLLARKCDWTADTRQIGAAALLGVLGLLCFRQASFYYSDLTLSQAAAAASPDSWAANFNMGIMLNPVGRSAEALVALRRAEALAIRPEFMMARGLAETLEFLKQFPEAEAYYKQALRLEPDFVDTYLNYGAFLADRNRLDEAVTQYQEALRRDPECGQALSNLGNALRQQGKLEEAARALADALKLEPDHADYYANLARVRIDQNQMGEAAELCLKAQKLNTLRDEGALVFIGQVILSAGKNKEAAAALEQALKINPQSPQSHYLLGAALEQSGNRSEAIRHYQQAVQLQPDYADPLARLRALGAPTP